MRYDPDDTAVVVIDPQNDVLSPSGTSWSVLKASVTENKTVEHLVEIFGAAKANGYALFVSPHYFYPTDHDWLFNGPLESDELRTHTFARSGALTLDGFAGSGADWVEELKPFIEDRRTVVASPHKVWGPQTNDLVLQLRKRGITKVILCGMLANICVESHLRDLLEHGFKVAVVRDATAGPRHPTFGDGYQAALVNYAFLAHSVAYTHEIVAAMASTRPPRSGATRASGLGN
jgi:nicotinamidase-related amidase